MKICRTCGKFGSTACESRLAEDHCQGRWVPIMSDEKKKTIQAAIEDWNTLADQELQHRLSGACLSPSASEVRENIYRNTVKALYIELQTGVAVCSCCLKPYGQGSRV